jgi:hypothetical protein
MWNNYFMCNPLTFGFDLNVEVSGCGANNIDRL